MTIEELIIYGKKHLHTTNCKMLLANIVGYDTLDLLNHLDEEVEAEKAAMYKSMVDAVKKDMPLQYVIGTACFYGYEFIVNEDVLIPRFETEELVENTIKFIKEKFKRSNLGVVDLGCGSGAIGITLKKQLPDLDVTCLDISEKALEITTKNAKTLTADINIIKGDMLDSITAKYDIIISNPPYIMEEEEIEESVKSYEPHIALYGGKDGLYYYRKILKSIKRNLNEKYLIAFEIGRTQKEAIFTIAKEFLPDATIECKKDLQDNDRMIFIYNF